MSEINFEEMDEKGILEVSIKSEMEAQKIYEAFLERDIPENFRNRVKTFLENERGHEKTVRNIFNDWYPDEEPDITKEPVEIEGKIREETNDVKDLLRMVMEDEKNAEKIYSKLGDKAKDKPQARVFKHLASMEWEHHEALKNEVEKFEERQS